MASWYLRGNCLGVLPSTCRKPVWLRLLEVSSYSRTPPGIRPSPGCSGTRGAAGPPALGLPAPCPSARPGEPRSCPRRSAEQGEAEFLRRCVAGGKDACRHPVPVLPAGKP